MDIIFNQQQADSLFPYHLKINSGGIIVDCGKSLRKICPAALNDLFINHFSIDSFSGEFIIDYLLQHLQEKMVIQTIEKGNKSTHLSGQFIFIEQSNLLVFLGSPAFSSIKEILSIIFDV